MEVTFLYGGGTLRLNLPDGSIIDQYAPAEDDSTCGIELFQARFQGAGGMDFLSSDNPLIIVNDGYRNTPTSIILSWLDSISPYFLDRTTLLIATGSHSCPTEAHMDKIFGTLGERLAGRISYHDATDSSTMMPVGYDRFGREVHLNREVARHDTVLIIGSVEPHYFAGFTGGRKALFPGLTDLATIERNHNMASNLAAAPLRLQGNPVAEHCDQLLDLIDISKFLSIQIIVNRVGGVAELFVGDLRGSFKAATAAATDRFAHVTDKLYDLIVAEIRSPLDKNLYQVQKGLENCQGVIRDGGMIILFSACEEGVGSPFFFQLAENWDRERNCSADGVERFGSHKLVRVNLIGRRIHVALRSELPNETVRRVFYEAVEAPQDLIDKFLTRLVRPQVAVVYDAGHTLLARDRTKSE